MSNSVSSHVMLCGNAKAVVGQVVAMAITFVFMF